MMNARSLFAGLAATAVTVSALALGTTGASAAPDADDTTFTPVAADLVGAGSDTSQHALKLLAEAWNSKTPAPTAKIATFAATGGGDVTLAAGSTIARPNGSGAGKKLLYGAGNNTGVDFARSSSAQSADETSAGLQSFPFAVDQLQMAVSNSAASNAPASLSAEQIVKIYKGDVTNWNQVGGKAGVIVPMIPQGGSGTRSFFEAQLKAANNGSAVTLAASVQEVQEHDDTPIKSNANAVAPFSSGRAGLLGKTLRLEGGWAAKRALYNVVRGADVNGASVLATFGPDGFLCSNEARPLIEKAGFDQLAGQASGGVCGVQTQTATSNFATNDAVPTTTTVKVSSTRPGKATVVARVTADNAPVGTVDIFDGTRKIASALPLVSSQATVTVTAAPGTRTYKAVFTPDTDSTFEPSQGTGSGLVKTTSTLKAAFGKKVGKKVTKVKGKVLVTLKGVSAKATGKVQVKAGKRVVASGTVKGGKVTLVIKGLKKGANKFTATWAGNAVAAGSTTKFTITRKR